MSIVEDHELAFWPNIVYILFQPFSSSQDEDEDTPLTFSSVCSASPPALSFASRPASLDAVIASLLCSSTVLGRSLSMSFVSSVAACSLSFWSSRASVAA